MKTTLKKFRFDTSKYNELQQWEELKSKLKSAGNILTEHRVYSAGRYNMYYILEGKSMEVEPDFLFRDQWNVKVEGVGLRVHDWLLEVCENKDIKVGYYIELTDDMKKLREKRFKCGFCGTQYEKVDNVMYAATSDGVAAREVCGELFCTKCSGSTSLEEKDFKLTRLKNVSDTADAKPVNEEQAEYLRTRSTTAYMQNLTSHAGKWDDHNKALAELKERVAVIEWFKRRGWAHNAAYRSAGVAAKNFWKFGWLNKVADHHVAAMHEELKTFPAQYVIELSNDRVANDARDSFRDFDGNTVKIVV